MKAFKGMFEENPKFTYKTRGGCVFTLHLATQAQLFPWTAEPAGRLIFLVSPMGDVLAERRYSRTTAASIWEPRKRWKWSLSTLFFCLLVWNFVCFVSFCLVIFVIYLYCFGGKEIRQMNKRKKYGICSLCNKQNSFHHIYPSLMLHLLYILI